MVAYTLRDWFGGNARSSSPGSRSANPWAYGASYFPSVYCLQKALVIEQLGFHILAFIYNALPAAFEITNNSFEIMVGAGRFELPTPCAQGRCATRLRYAPTCYIIDSKPLSWVVQRQTGPCPDVWVYHHTDGTSFSRRHAGRPALLLRHVSHGGKPNQRVRGGVRSATVSS